MNQVQNLKSKGLSWAVLSHNGKATIIRLEDGQELTTSATVSRMFDKHFQALEYAKRIDPTVKSPEEQTPSDFESIEDSASPN